MVNFLWENIFRYNRKGKDVPSILAENFLFQDLSRKELHLIEEIVHLRNYHGDELVFNQGEIGFGMYIIVKGSVDICVNDPLPEKDGNKENFVTRLLAGDFFGELSLVEENSIRPATARAHEETRLIGFFKPDLIEVMERSPSTGAKIAYRLAEVLGRRLKETTAKIAQLRQEVKSIKQRKPHE